MNLKFGIRIPNVVLPRYFPMYKKLDYNVLVDYAIESELLGYDSIWVNDHLIFGSGILECWTTLSSLVPITERVRLGTLVLCNNFRLPSVVAKMAATLDYISNGRLEFGIGAGWNEEEHKAYGIPFSNPVERVERLREAIEIIKRMWTERTPCYNGRYYRIEGAVCEPKPLQNPHPPITIGGAGEKLMMKLIAQHADRCNFAHRSPDEYSHKLSVLKVACTKVGRDFGEIEKSWWGRVIISKDEKEVKKQIKTLYKSQSRESPFKEWTEKVKANSIVGTPEECVEKLRKYIKLGVTYFILRFGDAPSKNGLRLFAEEVIPKL
ncbi:MAG: F420-dependent oxidoreductase [Thermoproteota archaeon]|nr:MAG: F420-dependent oxidoreductase [Candidatus Korarchaeota archaeon]